MTAYPQPLRLTVDEYLALEEASPDKHEFYRGEVYSMEPSSLLHGAICSCAIMALFERLRPKGCLVCSGSLRVRNTTDTLYTYPDLSVVCGRPEVLKQRGETLSNPTLIVEVLSPSTRSHDLNRKALEYKRSPSLQYLLFVDTEQVAVYLHSRQSPNSWLHQDFLGLESEIHLPFWDLVIPVRDFYLDVDLETL
jgi:Uma2 family endonuclease